MLELQHVDLPVDLQVLTYVLCLRTLQCVLQKVYVLSLNEMELLILIEVLVFDPVEKFVTLEDLLFRFKEEILEHA